VNIGVDFCLKEVHWNNNTTVSVQLWDIAGQERFANLTRMYYREARAAFVVFDIARDRTFSAVLKWKQDIDAKVALPDGTPIPVVLLANKCDLVKQLPNYDDFCREYGFLKWFATSAKENVGIDEASRFLIQTILESDMPQTTTAASSGQSERQFHHKSASGLVVTGSNAASASSSPSTVRCCA